MIFYIMRNLLRNRMPKKIMLIQKKENRKYTKQGSEDIKTYAKRARKLAESFAGDYIKNDDGFWSKLGDAYEFFFELPFILFDILTCYKKKCPSIEEIIYSAYHGYGEPQEALRRNIQIHTRFCSRCNKIDLFFTRVAEGASCPQWFRLRDFLTHPNLSMYKSDIIEQHILQCERCKCIAEIVRMKK
jgi:hypothetical protein